MLTNKVVENVNNILMENGFTPVEPYGEFGENCSQPLQNETYTVYMRKLGNEIQMKLYFTREYNNRQGGYFKYLNPETEDWSWILPPKKEDEE